MDKCVIVINGKGGVGKDTLCDAARDVYKVKNISAITPIKELAAQHGWKGEKDDKSRRFLAELKRVFVEYNDMPTRYLLEECDAFAQSDDEILFVHIREPQEISKFVSGVTLRCVTLLITGRDEGKTYGNAADDGVADYDYDFTYANVLPLEKAPADFVCFLQQKIMK